MSDILSFLLWYLAVLTLGLAAWPLAYRFLGHLPGRGWALSKTFGLLLVGYVFWLLGSLGFLTNTVGGLLFAIGVVLTLSTWAASKAGVLSLRTFAARNWQLIIVSEALFFGAFALWAYVRAHNPEIVATEKPMEFAFLNAIRRSGTFPPPDPWLSGYAISYYYFGYVIVAALALLTGTLPGVAFNLGVSLLFGLVAVGAWGVVYDLIAAEKEHGHGENTGNSGTIYSKESNSDSSSRPSTFLLLPALLGPLFVLLIGNLGGFLEVLHSKHVLWREGNTPGVTEPALESSFWKWLDLEELSDPPIGEPSWTSQRYLWWWRSSRVIRDRDLYTPLDTPTGWQFSPAFKFLGHEGRPIDLQPIDEFPMFSFLLGDMHPHVLALPFVLLAVACAFNLMLAPARPTLDAWRLALYSLVLGALSFLNTWDFPIYLFVTVGAYAIWRSRETGWRWEVLRDAAVTGGVLLVGGVALYLPFYLSFQTQAGGLLPNFIFPTRLPQFFVMFGPLLVIVLMFLGWIAARGSAGRRANWSLLPLTAVAVLVPVLVVTAALGIRVLTQSDMLAYVNDFLAPISLQEGLRRAVMRRLTDPWTTILLLLMLGLIASLLAPRRGRRAADSGSDSNSNSNPRTLIPGPSLSFALLLTGVAAMLTLGPEFLYLKDNFGARMNTIFKFYYQAWLQWGLVAAFATWYLNGQLRRAGRLGFLVVAVTVLAMGLVYPILGVATKANSFRGPATLDGFAYMAASNPADYNAIRWLNEHIDGGPVIAEAIGGQYSEFARVSASTGLPTVLGWPGHEGQWRGQLFGQQAGSREPDIELLYRSRSWVDAEAVLHRYDIRYVYFGALEASKYGLGGIAKFDGFMTPVYQADSVTIYERHTDAP